MIYAAAGWGSPVLMTVRQIVLFCSMNIQLKFAFIEGNLGWLYGELEIAPEVLVWLQSNALLLDIGRASTFCYFSMKTIYLYRRMSFK